MTDLPAAILLMHSEKSCHRGKNCVEGSFTFSMRAVKEVTAAVIAREGRILLLRRAPGQKHAGFWEFPGGKTEPGETPQACLERELCEELGIAGQVRAHIMDSPYSYPGGAINLRAYHFHWQGGELQLRVHDAVAWCLPGELTSYALTPADIPIARALAVGEGMC